MKKIRYFFEAIILYILYALFWLLPARVASNLGGWIGRTLGPKLSASRKPLKHLQLAMPEYLDHHQDIVNKMWGNLGRVIAEYAHIKNICSSYVRIENEDFIKEAIQSGRPVIFISGHLANWELIAPTLALQLNIPGLLVYRRPNNPFSAYLLDKARCVSPLMSFTTKSDKGMRDMIKCMRQKGTLGLLIDQKLNTGMETKFFDHPAMTGTAFIDLAKKYNAIIIPLRIQRLHDINFSMTCYKPLDVQNKTVEEIIHNTHILLESWIRERPEQWLWLHKRWKDNK